MTPVPKGVTGRDRATRWQGARQALDHERRRPDPGAGAIATIVNKETAA